MALTPWIESILSRDAILRSPLLCSCVRNGNELFLDDVRQLPTFGALDVSRDELRKALSDHKTAPKSCIQSVTFLSVVLNFFVDPTTLIIRTSLTKPQQQQLRRMIVHICGEAKGKVMSAKGSEISIKFTDPAECFAFWRALPYVPLGEILLDASMGVLQTMEKKPASKKKYKNNNKNSKKSKPPEVLLKPSDFPPLSLLG